MHKYLFDSHVGFHHNPIVSALLGVVVAEGSIGKADRLQVTAGCSAKQVGVPAHVSRGGRGGRVRIGREGRSRVGWGKGKALVYLWEVVVLD